MLLLTDRPAGDTRLKRIIEQISWCAVVQLDEHAHQKRTPTVIVCDVSLNSIASTKKLGEILFHYKGIPIVFIVRDPSHITHSQAYTLGATAVLPWTTMSEDIIKTLCDIKATFININRNEKTSHSIILSVKEAFKTLSTLLAAARGDGIISQDELAQTSNIIISSVKRNSILTWLDEVWKYDDVTYQHCLLVAGLVAGFSLKLGLSPQTQDFLSQAALLHDIGKARIPYAILNKPGRLTAAEMNVMRMHPAIGHAMLIKQNKLDPRMLAVVRHHHEYLDGSGYPDGLSAQQIPDFVRLVTICDIYAAMIERRSYKEPTSAAIALTQLRDMGPKLDGTLLQAFQKTMQVQA